MVTDRYKQIVSWMAVLIGGAGEALLIWLIDQLPLWAQILVYGSGGLTIVFGFYLIGRDAVRARARRRLKAQAQQAQAQQAQ